MYRRVIYQLASSIKGIEFDGLATLATKTIARKKNCIHGYAFDVASVSLFCVRHAKPHDMRAAI